MLIYELLRTDHRVVVNIMEAIEMVTDHERRKDLFSLMRTELTMHSKSEEDHFYEPLRARLKDDQMIGTSFDEHHEIEHYLMKLQTTPANEKWMDTLRDLRATIQRHVIKEENDVFVLAKQHFTTEEAVEMGIRFLEGKGKLGMENPISVVAHKVKELIS